MTYYGCLGYCDPCSYSLPEKCNASNGYQRLYIQILPSEYYACSPCWDNYGHQISCVFPWYRMRFSYCSPCYSYNCCSPSYCCDPFCHTLRSSDYIPRYKSTSLLHDSYNYSPSYGPKTRCYSPYYGSKTKECIHSSSNHQFTHRYGSPSSYCSPCYRTETIRGTPCYSSNECSSCYSSPLSSCYDAKTKAWSPCYSSNESSSCYDSPSSSCSSCYAFKTKGCTPCYNNHQHSPCHRCFSPYYTSRSRCCSPGYTYRRCSPCCSSKGYSPHYNSGSKCRTPSYRYSQCLSCYRSRCHSPYYHFGSRCGAPGYRNSHYYPCGGADFGCHSPSHSSTCSSSHSTSCTYSMKSNSYSSGCRRCSCPW